MKESTAPNFKTIAYAIALCVASMTVSAQKLPNIQKDAVYAPDNVRADGKTTEWDNIFQAYNKSTDVFYTIANNADNLYFTIQATDPDIINKIISGGIAFTIKSADKKSTIVPVIIGYPIKAKVTPTAGGGGAGANGGRGVSRVELNGASGPRSSSTGGTGLMATLKSTDPVSDETLLTLNNQINDNVKEIIVTGVKEIPDSAISVYNDQGINAAMLIGKNKAYTIELAVALKYLQPVINTNGTFNYNIKLNGLNMSAMKIVINGAPADANSPQMATVMSIMAGSGGNPSFQSLTSPTDFSGTYTLAKK